MTGSRPSDERAARFDAAGRLFAQLDAETASRVIAAAADVALVLDDGVIRDVAIGNEELEREGYQRGWRDKPWVETVTIESRPKIEELLAGGSSAAGRWREVNHPTAAGASLPVKYVTVGTPGSGRLLALGRDLRSEALLQQRLVEAHQHLERDYSRLREAEARYRLLFQSVSQALLVVDSATLEVEEANPAAANLLGETLAALVGAPFETLFSRGSQRAVARAVAETLSIGSTNRPNLRTRGGASCSLAGSAFRQDDATKVIVRLDGEAKDAAGAHAAGEIPALFEALPDGLVVANAELRVVAANPAFVEMTQLLHRGQLVGSQLSDFLGRSPTDLNVLISNLKTHGVVRNFTTVLRDRFGNEEEVEVSAVSTPSLEAAAYGFSIRSVARRLRADSRIGDELPSSVEQLTGLVGRVPLRQIVRESTDFIEKLCIEAALEITADNRASAAEMLGLSRQGLYSKLKRFGLDD